MSEPRQRRGERQRESLLRLSRLISSPLWAAVAQQQNVSWMAQQDSWESAIGWSDTALNIYSWWGNITFWIGSVDSVPQRRWPVYVLWIYCEGGLVLKAPWKRRFRKRSFAIFRLHACLSDCQRCITVIVLVATRNLDMLSLILSWMLAVGR